MVDRARIIGVRMKQVKVKVGDLIKLTRQPDDDSIWIVLKVRHFFKHSNNVNAVRIRDMNSTREIWYPSRHIEVIV